MRPSRLLRQFRSGVLGGLQELLDDCRGLAGVAVVVDGKLATVIDTKV